MDFVEILNYFLVYVVPAAIDLFHQLLNSIILPIVLVYIADEDSP